MNNSNINDKHVSGEFITLQGERYYAIRNHDEMPAFFISVVSSHDHWMFASSTGGLSAGRVSPDTALFPYVTVDKIHESHPHTGPKTLVRVKSDQGHKIWEPFNQEHDDRFAVTRNLYKNTLGNKLCFEEINHDLGLTFRYTWATSDEFGFVRQCELSNDGGEAQSIEILDGMQNLLPAGTPRFTQTQSSNLVDAYKWSELDQSTGLGMFTLYSAITDRAEPCESLRANTVFCLGLDAPKILLSSEQIKAFKRGQSLESEPYKRGVRGAYMVSTEARLDGGDTLRWQLVANLELDQSKVAALQMQLQQPGTVAQQIDDSIAAGSDALARIMAAADGFQCTNEETVSVHHYANVLFNVLRGGIFDDQYRISGEDFRRTVQGFNQPLYLRNESTLTNLADKLSLNELVSKVEATDDVQLKRLLLEYLPITFGRRHGDPSRPWNQFAIKIKDEAGNPLLSYQGNWRDIFQNWEALLLSYPSFTESVIAKFVNASTVDGYNPYRITKEGIDWEVEDPEDPWSYIGYWGDHQIIYLLKLLELSRNVHPGKLNALLRSPLFSYANVPYRLKPFNQMLKDAKDTVMYDESLADKIEARVASLGADGKMLLDGDDTVYQVNLMEKLLVPLLAKLGNLVVDGGLWLNTQRPEWNDANNALVGQGLSMVTLYYVRRYIHFMQILLSDEQEHFALSSEVAEWLLKTTEALSEQKGMLSADKVDDKSRFALLEQLGQVASDIRETIYANEGFSGTESISVEAVNQLLSEAQAYIDHSIASNLGDDGLFHAYNLLSVDGQEAQVKHLYPMLEGQVAALSSGAISTEQCISALDELFASKVYRADQDTFMLYPDRPASSFMDKNRFDQAAFDGIPALSDMMAKQDYRLIAPDPSGDYRFNADITNVGALRARADEMASDYPSLNVELPALEALYERVFNHQAFTGRSGGMFGFEGLGSIYWHMVSKLLLAVMENLYEAVERGASEQQIAKLGQLYYHVRHGIGFNKTPLEYGAFPTDPYSHTPGHAGAQQPGMTGQVKEEILSRAGELGVKFSDGKISFDPCLLRQQEFLEHAVNFTYLDVADNWQTFEVPASALAFTLCQVPVVYTLDSAASPSLSVDIEGTQKTLDSLSLDETLSAEVFERSGKITRICLTVTADMLFQHDTV